MGDHDPDEGTVDVAEAIGLLGDAQRLGILVAVADPTRGEKSPWEPMSFTELYEAADVDSTSGFAYHLEKLVGPYLTETSEGYRLTYNGARIVRTIRSGRFEATPAFDDERITGTCAFCASSPLVATLEDELFVVRCPSCSATLVTDYFPRSQSVGRTPSAIVESFGHRIWSSVIAVRGGVCPECFGRVESHVEPVYPVDTPEGAGSVGTPDEDGSEGATEGDESLYWTHISACRTCWFEISFPVEVIAAFHPAAIGYCYAQGVLLWDVPLWAFFEYLTTGAIQTDMIATDPMTLGFEFRFGDTPLCLEMDETLSVTVQ